MQFFNNYSSMYPSLQELTVSVWFPHSSQLLIAIWGGTDCTGYCHLWSTSTCSGIGTDCRVDPCFPTHLHGQQGKICFITVYTIGYREAPPSPDLGIRRAVSLIFSLLSHSCCTAIFTLKCVTTEVIAALPAWAVAGPLWSWVKTDSATGSSCCLLKETFITATHYLKTCHVNSIHKFNKQALC